MSFRIHNDAISDLKTIAKIDKAATGKLAALLQQIQHDPSLISKLLDHGYGKDKDSGHTVSVMKWIGFHKRENLPIWRLKSWSLEREGLKYRIIYCYNWPDQSYNVMAIVPRNGIDYDDPNHPIRQRILETVRREFPRA